MSKPGQGLSVAYQFQYFSRYVARLLNVRYEYRGPLVGWRLTFPQTPNLHAKSQRPTWYVSEAWPWNLANRISEYPYPNIRWKIEYDSNSDGTDIMRHEVRRLRGYFRRKIEDRRALRPYKLISNTEAEASLPSHQRLAHFPAPKPNQTSDTVVPTANRLPERGLGLPLSTDGFLPEQEMPSQHDADMLAAEGPTPTELIDEAIIFRGDQVQILVGPDAGKRGRVRAVLKLLRLCYVDGLNATYVQDKEHSVPRIIELPLHLEKDIALYDPQDDMPTRAVWRYSESGQRIRVSARTGCPMPLPKEAYTSEDGVQPTESQVGPKDTLQEAVKEKTYVPSCMRVEQELERSLDIEEVRHRAPTYWY